jgi:FixJ family two-component response regulator
MVQYPSLRPICYRRHGMDRSRLRVAVIDDDESVRKALKRLLRAASLDADTFASGGEFLHSLATQLPDCIVLDLHMPGMNGLDVQQQLARSGLRVPIVVITGHDEPQARAQCLSAGAAAYLRKPLDDEALLDAIHRAAGVARPSLSD